MLRSLEADLEHNRSDEGRCEGHAYKQCPLPVTSSGIAGLNLSSLGSGQRGLDGTLSWGILLRLYDCLFELPLEALKYSDDW